MALTVHLHLPHSLTTVRSQDSSQSNGSGPPSTSSPGQGFGPPPPKPKPGAKKRDKWGRRERAPVIRRTPVENPQFAGSDKEKARTEEEMRNDSGFLLAWLGLGGVILLQGIALAASGFLPEGVDKFFVKYLYPSFTPTVFLFVAGTVTYGVLKYLKNEKLKNEN